MLEEILLRFFFDCLDGVGGGDVLKTPRTFPYGDNVNSFNVSIRAALPQAALERGAI